MAAITITLELSDKLQEDAEETGLLCACDWDEQAAYAAQNVCEAVRAALKAAQHPASGLCAVPGMPVATVDNTIVFYGPEGVRRESAVTVKALVDKDGRLRSPVLESASFIPLDGPKEAELVELALGRLHRWPAE